jgi:hypothetical protein
LELTSFDFGYFEFTVASPRELVEFQVGYAVDDDGNSLTGDDEGDWRKGWVVFAQDFLSDPVFTDMTIPTSPVFHAAHGEGAWDPVEIAPSLDAFATVLQAARCLAEGRESPVTLEANPVTDAEKTKFRDVVIGNGASEEYWLTFFEDDEDAI